MAEADPREWMKAELATALDPGEEILAVGAADYGFHLGRVMWVGAGDISRASPSTVVLTSVRLFILEGQATQGKVLSRKVRGMQWSAIATLNAGKMMQRKHIEFGRSGHECHMLHFFEKETLAPDAVQADFYARAVDLAKERYAAARRLGPSTAGCTLQSFTNGAWTALPPLPRNQGPVVVGCVLVPLTAFLVVFGLAVSIWGGASRYPDWGFVGIGCFASSFGLVFLTGSVAYLAWKLRPGQK